MLEELKGKRAGQHSIRINRLRDGAGNPAP
jgi:hypothetical protein